MLFKRNRVITETLSVALLYLGLGLAHSGTYQTVRVQTVVYNGERICVYLTMRINMEDCIKCLGGDLVQSLGGRKETFLGPKFSNNLF